MRHAQPRCRLLAAARGTPGSSLAAERLGHAPRLPRRFFRASARLCEPSARRPPVGAQRSCPFRSCWPQGAPGRGGAPDSARAADGRRPALQRTGSAPFSFFSRLSSAVSSRFFARSASSCVLRGVFSACCAMPTAHKAHLLLQRLQIGGHGFTHDTGRRGRGRAHARPGACAALPKARVSLRCRS